MRTTSSLRVSAGLGVLALAQFLPFWARGQGSFWGDLFYLHWPWRAFDAQCLQAGRLPLWNPSLYFGMPAAATMQDALYYPLTVPFFIFRFPTALALFQLAHYQLAGFFCWLWLRRAGARRGAALAGAVLYMLGGVLISNQGFLNHLGVLALWPAALALASHPAGLGLSLALMFFAGYPPFFLGAAALALLAAGRGAVKAGLIAALVSAVLLIPGAELVLHSKRSAGVGIEEALRFGLTPADLWRWISPILSPERYDPAIDWWRTCYLGFSGAALAALGWFALPRRRAIPAAAVVFTVLLLMLGESVGLSKLLWTKLTPLKFIRYPGNVAYLALPALSVLAAAGAAVLRGRARALALLALTCELTALSWYGFKGAPRLIWETRSPLVAALQNTLEDGRYLLSPLALETHAGSGLIDWATRLYGLTNSPYRARAAGNFGEPLVPRENYLLMDQLYSANPREIAPLLPWIGVGALLATRPLEGVPGLSYERDLLWSLHRAAQPYRAAWLSGAEGERLPVEARVPERLRPRRLPVDASREDRFIVAGKTGAGWVYLAEPRFPGWKLYLETELGPGRAAALPALGPFQRVAVPAGSWTLTWRYEPASFAWGLALTVPMLLWLGAGLLKRSRGLA